MSIMPVLKGLATYIPGLYSLYSKGTGGSVSARYCYSVWLRHLIMASRHGLPTRPDVVAELGPGDSLGLGLAALLSGASKYYAFDVVRYANNERNVEMLEELVDLFKRREKIPDENEFPRVRPRLDSYEFPENILTADWLSESLCTERIESVRDALLNPGNNEKDKIHISYYVPWHDPKVVKEASVDMLITQGVMQLVDNLEPTYESLSHWIKPGGFMSHEMDFTCLRTAKEWNGHWTYSDFLWRLIKGNKPWIINREPHSVHIHLMQKYGLKIVCDLTVKKASNIQRKRLAPHFKYLNDDDLTTSGAFIQAVKL